MVFLPSVEQSTIKCLYSLMLFFFFCCFLLIIFYAFENGGLEKNWSQMLTHVTNEFVL